MTFNKTQKLPTNQENKEMLNHLKITYYCVFKLKVINARGVLCCKKNKLKEEEEYIFTLIRQSVISFMIKSCAITVKMRRLMPI